jgi:hypothetical protein
MKRASRSSWATTLIERRYRRFIGIALIERRYRRFIGIDAHRATLQEETQNRRTGKPDAAISYSSNNLMNQALGLRLTTDS